MEKCREDRKMRKMNVLFSIFAVLLLQAAGLLTGCITKSGEEQKINEPAFDVIDREDEPDELSAMIEEEKEHPFRIVYADQGKLYIAQGYGRQPTTGYSVAVRELYETENTICIHTNLMGPEKGEDIREIETFPYVTVQLDDIDKEVIFD